MYVDSKAYAPFACTFLVQERLQQLYNGLAQFRESVSTLTRCTYFWCLSSDSVSLLFLAKDLEKSGEGDKLIETVRQITEAIFILTFEVLLHITYY